MASSPSVASAACAADPMPSCSAARHTSSGSSTGSAAATSNSSRASSGSASSRRRKLSSIRPGSGIRAVEPEPARQVRRGQRSRQLEDRQRVAARLRDEPVADALVEPARDDGREQGARVLLGEPSERQLRQADQLALVRRLAHGEDDRHRLGQQPSRDEAQDLAGSGVEPLGVVDEAQQRALRGDLGQQAERGQGDQEAVGRGAGRQAQRDAQRGLLGLRERAEPTEHRRAELMQSRERQLHLGLDPGDPGDAEARRLPSAMVQQRRLADARLAADDQHCALPAADVLQQPVERLALAGSPQQHRRTGRGHRSGSVNDAGNRAGRAGGRSSRRECADSLPGPSGQGAFEQRRQLDDLEPDAADRHRGRCVHGQVLRTA